ncbi:MAG: DUF6476 family protein [Hyphomicrobiaceae bacterium]
MTSDPIDPATRASTGTESQAKGPLTEGQLRALKFAVYGMGVLLILGFLVIVGRIIYLIAQAPATPPPPDAVTAAIKSEAKLALPAGANIRHLSMTGNRLAIHYDAPGGSAIVIFDLGSGTIVSRIAITPGP